MGIAETDLLQFNPNHLLYKMAEYTKGRQLVIRTLLLLPQALSFRVFCILIGNFGLFSNPTRRGRLDKRASEAFQQILSQCLPDEIPFIFFRFLTEPNILRLSSILMSKAGICLMKHFLLSGHTLRQNPFPLEVVGQWYANQIFV
jgi:hypothetical protein